jgi:hypothetical protein
MKQAASFVIYFLQLIKLDLIASVIFSDTKIDPSTFSFRDIKYKLRKFNNRGEFFIIICDQHNLETK